MQITVLSTKKISPKQECKLLEKTFTLVQWDFISMKYQEVSLDEIGNLLLFTSQNAVKSILNNQKITLLKQIPAICVGKKTADLLRKNGWNVLCYKEYATELGEYILQHHSQNNIAFFSGNLRRDVLPNVLKNNNIIFKEYEVYQTIFCPHKINVTPQAIFFFSPSGVISYAQHNTFSDAICFCIGTTTANEVLKHTKNVIISEKPTIDSVIDACITYFQK